MFSGPDFYRAMKVFGIDYVRGFVHGVLLSALWTAVIIVVILAIV